MKSIIRFIGIIFMITGMLSVLYKQIHPILPIALYLFGVLVYYQNIEPE